MLARRPARASRRLLLPATLAAVASATLIAAPAASGQAPAPTSTITSSATGRVIVDRDVAKNSKAIVAAVEAARERAVRLAIANAREEATRLAAAGGLTLGALVSMSEPVPSPFFGGTASYGSEGTFGPGKFCGTIRTPIRRRTAGGRLQNVGTRSRFGCRIPPEVSQAVSATFAVS